MTMETIPDDIKTVTYQRHTHKRQRAKLLAAFPAEEVHHELTDRLIAAVLTVITN